MSTKATPSDSKSLTSLSRRNDSRGFTLIELLVVIAIISLLAAILFPVFETVREKARQSACMSNLKQIGMGVMLYYQDADERTPSTYDNGGSSYGWAGVLYRYVKNTQVYQCPDEEFPASSNYVVSYAYNMNIRGAIQGTYFTGLAIPSFNQPTETVLIFEWDPYSASNPMAETVALTANPSETTSHTCNGTNGGSYMDVMGPMDNASGYGGNYWRHDNGANYLFVDGHVKFLQPITVSAGNTPATPTAAQYGGPSTCNGQARCAEGTLFSGAAKHEATFSPI